MELNHARAIDLGHQKIRIDTIGVEGISPRESKLLLGSRFMPKKGLYGRKEIEALVSFLYGTRAFESVTYRLSGDEEPYALIFDCQKGQTNEFGVGLHSRLLQENGSGFSSTSLLNRIDLFAEDATLVYGKMRFGLSADLSTMDRFTGPEGAFFYWDAKSVWFSTFADLTVETFNDGYFPTKGFRFVADGRYMFQAKREMWNEELDKMTYDKVPPYFVGLSSVEGAITVGRFTFLPRFYFSFTNATENQLHMAHRTMVGGLIPGRYYEYQLPFFGLTRGFRYQVGYNASPQADVRFRLNRKTYLTGRSALLVNSTQFRKLFDFKHESAQSSDYAFGLEFGRKTALGPVQLGAAWSKRTHFGWYFSLGFDF